MNLFIIVLSAALGICALLDSFTSYRKGVFKEYRKMAPFIYHYRGEKWFIAHILGNALAGLILIGVAIWLW